MKAILLFSMIFVFFTIVSVAEINVYFTHSVDTTYANPTPAQGHVELDEKLINRIVQAQYSIDFCFQDIKRQNIVDSLISAFSNRDVSVRVITDDNYITNPACSSLIYAGIPVIHDTFPSNHNDYTMHNKFAIFDFKDSSSMDDDWIWTGSYNITDNGTDANANNAVEIQDHELAQAYTIEFEEMWGSDSNIPDPDSSKFSTYKTDNTEHYFLINTIPVELYFAPTDSSSEKISDAILTADSTIDFCIYAFTLQEISDAMKVLWDANQPDTTVRGVFDLLSYSSIYSERWDMQGYDTTGSNPWNPPAPALCDSVDNPLSHKLHHKYMIIDVDRYSDPILITGSQNWSAVGGEGNDENTLIIHSQNIANQYLQEFIVRYAEAGGDTISGCLEKSNDLSLNKIRIFPNPFTNRLRIEGCSKIKVYDISGKFVAEFKQEWNGKDINGEEVSAGIYFLRFKRENIGKVLKLRRGL